MKPFYALFIIFNLVGFKVVAKHQTPAADSLKKLIKPALRNAATLPDTLTIGRINQLADGYFESYPDSCTYYGNLEIALSKKINYLKGIADGTIQVASVNTFKGEYAASGQNYTFALKLYLQIGDKHGISESYIGLGRVQDYLGNYDNAVSLFTKALAIRLQSGVPSDIADCYNIMGITYDNKGDLPKALDYYFKALIINIKDKNSLAAADNYCNIGVIMQHLELHDKALAYFKRALGIWQKLDDKQGISTACENIGEVLIDQKKYGSALSYLNKASALFRLMNDSEGISLVEYDLGLYYYYTGSTVDAIRNLNLSLQNAKKDKIKYNKAYAYVGLARVYNREKNFNQAYDNALMGQITANYLGSLNARADATLQLSVALAGLKKFEQAYAQHELYTRLKDSLNNNETIHKLISYNLEIDFEKKQKEVANQQRQRDAAYRDKIAHQENEIAIYGGVIALLAIMLLIYYNGKRKQQKINLLLAVKNEEIIGHQENLNAQAEKLNELNLLKDRLIGILAHDLRAPISTLRGLFNLMTTANITTEEFTDMIPKVFTKLEHTSDFLDTLLFWINSQVGTKPDNMQRFAIAELATHELESMEDQLKNKNLSVNINIPSNTIAFADPNSVRIVIHNFLTNAIKFSHRHGVIEITAFTDNDKVIFTLKDHGVGMPKEYTAGLFKSQVVSLAGTENEIGTGMGLLFCKDLIQKQQGTIWVKSTLGRGTELGFGLPVGGNVVI